MLGKQLPANGLLMCRTRAKCQLEKLNTKSQLDDKSIIILLDNTNTKIRHSFSSLVPRVVPLGATRAEPLPGAANTSPWPRLPRRCQSTPPEARAGARKAAAGLLPKLWSTVAARASLGSSTAATPARIRHPGGQIRHSRGRICAELRRESCCNSWSRGDRGERRVSEVAAWLGRI